MLGTAPGLLSLLTENNTKFQIHGLDKLEEVVETEWPQIADQIELILKLGGDSNFPAHQKAYLLASKVYYYMGNVSDAVKYAVLSGESFIQSPPSEFTSSVSAHCIQAYIKIMEGGEQVPSGLKEIVEAVLNDYLNKSEFSKCICLAIETRLIEYVRTCIQREPSLVHKAIEVTVKSVSDMSYRQTLLKLMVELASDQCNTFQLCHLHQSLSDPAALGKLLVQLRLSTNTDDWLLAYQIAFDLAENANQKFRSVIIDSLPAEQEDLRSILTRRMLLDQYLQFLFKNNKTDIHILVALKETLKTTKMIVHSSVVTAYSFMYAGTGDDNFYRNNTTWFANASKWAQFTTIAAVGTIHIGHLKSALQILDSFLNASTPAYALGGGLFALGLIYANYTWDKNVIERVTNHIKNTRTPIVKHGGCLALGLIGMSSQDGGYYDIIHNVLQEDSPEAGESAGYALGMIMLGSGPSEKVDELLRFAHNCEHEKVVRGLSMGLAFMMYGLEEKSETLVAALMGDRQPILRESAAWVTALAYVGTASNVALQRLLHLAVSDVNPDVRRAAVIGVGFVLSRSPKEVPSMVDLLAKSYHPHVRSGAALALGIACAGTGMAEAIAILEPLLDDLEDFVKQSAMIAMAMVLQQQSDRAVPYCKKFRAYLRKLISKERSDLTVFGLCLAYGILNASGRNVVISCNSLRGENSVLSTVGAALFCNFFYWQPLALALTLSFHTTAIIGLDKDFNRVEFPIFSGQPPSMFANPPSFESEKEVVALSAAVPLSISKEKASEEKPKEKPKEVEAPEQEYEMLSNPARVTLNQLQYIDLQNASNEYKPITDEVFHGFVMLKKAAGEKNE